MDYTLKEYYINGSDPELEKELLSLWVENVFKKEPLPEFSQKTIHEKFSAAYNYFGRHFSGNLCLYCDLGFAVFGIGGKWLDEDPQLKETPIVLIMGATRGKSLKDAFLAVRLLEECFKILKNKGWKNILWNINRETKKRPFERLLSKIGENKEKYWQAL